MAGELPDIEQEFIADVTRWLAGVEAMIQSGREFIENCAEETAAVEALQLEIDHLEGKIIEIATVYTSEGFGESSDDFARLSEMIRAVVPETDAVVDGLNRLSSADSAASVIMEDGNNVIEGKVARLSQLKQATDELGLTEEDLASASAIASDAFLRQSGTADSKAAKMSALMQAVSMVSDYEQGLGVSAMDVAAKMEESGSYVDKNVLSLWQLRAALEDVGLSEEDAAALAEQTGSKLFTQGQIAKDKSGKLLDLMASAGEAAIAEQALAEAADNSGNAAASGRIRIGWYTMSLTTLHWIVSGTIEVLAVLIPALVAVGAAADVGLQGVMETADRMKSLYAVTESLGGAFNVTGGMVYGLKGNLQAAQNAADPQIWELLGEGIKAVGDSSGWFIKMGEQVIQILDAFGARVDVDVDSNMKQMQSVLGDGAKDLAAFGQVFGNLGMAIFSAASQMPGLAEVLLELLADITRVISVVVQFAGEFRFMGVSILTVTMAIEEFMRWGGLLVSMMGGIGIATTEMGDKFLSVQRFQGVFMSLALAIPNAAIAAAGGLGTLTEWVGGLTGKLAVATAEVPLLGATMDGLDTAVVGASVGLDSFAASLGAIVAEITFVEAALGVGLVVGLVLAVVWLSNAKTAAQQFIDKLQDVANNATFGQGMVDLANNMQVFTQRAQEAAQASQSYAKASSDAGTYSVKNAGDLSTYTTSLQHSTQAVNEYNQASQQAAEQEGNAISAITSISQKYGVTLPQALALANTAGLKLGTSLTSNGQLTASAAAEVAGLVSGYQAMSGSALGLGNNVAAVNAQLGLQGSQLSKVNGAWDQFLANAIGGTQAYATLNDDISTMGNVTTDATSKITSFAQQSTGLSLSVKQISEALKTFGPESSQVWQNYDSALTQAGTVTDWWRTAAASGTVTGKQMNEAIADTAAQLLPFAANSTTAAAQLGVLVQEAGGPALTNYKALKTWIDANSTSQASYNALLGATTTQMSNVSAAAAQFSQTMDAMVVTAVEQGSVNLGAITTDAKQFTDALKDNQGEGVAVSGSLKTLVGQLYATNIGAANVKTMVQQMGSNMHLSAGQAKELADEAYDLYQNLDKIHNVSATVSISEDIHTSQTGATGPVSPSVGKYVPGVATGGRIPGYGGGDSFMAMLEPGEAVVPKHLVGGVAPYLGAHGVPGFAKGGMVESPMEKVIGEWASRLWKDDISRFGKKGPIGASEMKALLGPSKLPDTGVWSHPQYRDLGLDERKDMDPYYVKDLLYNKVLGQITSLKSGEKSQIADWESQIAYNKTHPADAAYWDAVYNKDISSLRKEDAGKLREFQSELDSSFRSMGYSKGGVIPFGQYDQGGYLPMGLSMALNTTGRPEAVGGGGGGGGGGDGPVHVHVEVGGKQIAEAILPGMVSATARYGIRNSGRATGLLRPS